jgi:hypothetical protein
VLYGGLSFIVIFGYLGPGDRPVLFSSNPISIADTNTPLLALLIYMVLTTQKSLPPQELALLLSIAEEVPEPIGERHSTPQGDTPPTSTPPTFSHRTTRATKGDVSNVRAITLTRQPALNFPSRLPHLRLLLETIAALSHIFADPALASPSSNQT